MDAIVTSTRDPGATAPASPPPGATPDAGDAIATVGLTKVYPGAITAVDGLDLSVRSGEIFGLLGPNGAGKTTTVGMLTTRIVATGGTAVVGGVDVVSEPARAREVLGVVSQSNTLDRGLKVRENLYFHGRYFGMTARAAREAADLWLEAFRLGHRANAAIETLSGGMARRVMLARAMLHGPSVVFLDEPTAGLDPQSRLALWDIIEGLRAAGRTVLLTTHQMKEADEFCDRVAIMDHGRILALDTPARLKRSIGTGATITGKVEGDGAGLAGRLGAIEGLTGTWSPDGVLRLRVTSADGAARVMAAAGPGFRVSDVASDKVDLEDVFIQLTGRDLRE